MENELKYSEWQDKGYKVHRGQKAAGFKDGEATFKPSQVYDPSQNELTEAHETYCERAEMWEEPQF